MLDVKKTLRDLSVQFQSDQLLITDVGRKIEATLPNLEVLKPRFPPQTPNPKLPHAHYQVKFEANYNPVAGILECGKDLKQEVTLSTIELTENSDETFSSFITATTEYLEKRFEIFSQEPIVHFEVFDHRKLSQNRTERAIYGDQEISSLLEYFSSVLSEDEKIAAQSLWQELKSYFDVHRTCLRSCWLCHHALQPGPQRDNRRPGAKWSSRAPTPPPPTQPSGYGLSAKKSFIRDYSKAFKAF